MATAGRIYDFPLPPFGPVWDQSPLGQCWIQWKRRFEIYFLAVNVAYDAQNGALLLYQTGAATQEVCDTLPIAGNEVQDYNVSSETIDSHSLPQKNVDSDIFLFLQAKLHLDKTRNQFVASLC